MALDIVIMAAGKGTRMKSNLPKVLHRLAGRPLLQHVLQTAARLGADRIVTITGHGAEQVEAAVSAPHLRFVRQEPQLGTGHAVQQAQGALEGFEGDDYVMVAVDDGPRLGFQHVPEPTPGKNRVHLDLTAPDRELEVERLLVEGALPVARHEVNGFVWVVLADPEGNQFCVSQAH